MCECMYKCVCAWRWMPMCVFVSQGGEFSTGENNFLSYFQFWLCNCGVLWLQLVELESREVKHDAQIFLGERKFCYAKYWESSARTHYKSERKWWVSFPLWGLCFVININTAVTVFVRATSSIQAWNASMEITITKSLPQNLTEWTFGLHKSCRQYAFFLPQNQSQMGHLLPMAQGPSL